jgi:hypothetical protein
MITHKWKIHDIEATNGLITDVKYSVLAKEIDTTVETEGYWKFGDPVLRKPLLEVKEEDVIAWVRADSMREGVNIIESRLEEQLANLEKDKVKLPWVAQVFTVNLG